MLKTKEFTFRVVTPLYLGGVDPRAKEARAKRDTQIRLRPILAMWRYWFRALKGAELGTHGQGLREVESKEQRLFGGVRGEYPTAAGIRARLTKVERVEHLAYTELDPHKSQYGRYLGYGLQQQRQGDDVTEECRWAIQPGCKFAVEVTAKDSDFDTLEQIIDTWVHCGGLGARHRRGWGCIEWTNRPQTGDYFKWLADRMKGYEGTMPTEPEFDVLHPDWCRIQICNGPSGKPFTSLEDALAAIRNQLRIDAGYWDPKKRKLVQDKELQKLKDEGVDPDPKKKQAVQLRDPINPPPLHLGANGYGWRQRWGDGWHLSGRCDREGRTWTFAFYQARDHDEAAKAWRGRGHPPPNLKNIQFGLPVAYPTWGGMMVEPKLGDERIRRPSPISFRISGSNANYRVTVLLFKSRFLPNNQLSIEANGHRVRKPTDWKYLDDFFEACHGQIVFGKGRS